MSDPSPLPDVLDEIRNLPLIECGTEAAKHFAFDDGYTNLNHGSYGTYPIPVRTVFRKYQELTEARPDEFVRYRYRTHLLDGARAVLADYLQVPLDTCVFAPNATLAFDTILHNFTFRPDDVIVCFATIYGSFENTLTWLGETTPVSVVKIPYAHPTPDDALCALFETTLARLRAAGRTPRLAVYDTVSSTPAVRAPFERLTRLCRRHGVLSVIDAAHGIGHVPLGLAALDPDFLVSNCHKWLHVPRGCAVLYVPERNQGALRATLPTGFGFVPEGREGRGAAFVANFASLGTLDDNPYLCVGAALEWRGKLTWGSKKGEEAVMGYVLDLARRGGEAVRDVLGTEILGGKADSGMVNVRLPLDEDEVCGGEVEKREKITQWLMRSMIVDRSTACFVMFYGDAWWVRLSAQVYLTIHDFEKAARRLLELCEVVRQGKY